MVTQRGNVATAILEAAGTLDQGRRLLQTAPGAAPYPSGPPWHMPHERSFKAGGKAHALPDRRRRCQGWDDSHGRDSLLFAWDQRQTPLKGECRVCCMCLENLCDSAVPN